MKILKYHAPEYVVLCNRYHIYSMLKNSAFKRSYLALMFRIKDYEQT